MGILEYIHSTNKQKRAQFSVLVAGGITGVIALIWISTIPARMGDSIALNNLDADTEPSPEEVEKKDIGSAISDTKSQLGSLFESNKKALQDIKNEFEEDTPGEQGTTQNQEASVIEGVADVSTAPTAMNSVTVSSDQGTGGNNSESTTSPLSDPIPHVDTTPRVILIGTTTSR